MPSAGPAGTSQTAGTTRLIFYALLAICLMALDSRGLYVERARNAALNAVEPLFLLVDLPGRAWTSAAAYLARRDALDQRLDLTERQLLEARARAARSADLARENERLRALLEAGRDTALDFVAAELTGIDFDPFAHRIMVSRGRSDGVVPGLPVIDDRGVIGQIESVMRHSARVVLVSDPDHALPVQVLPSGERTIAYGSGALDRLRLTDLPMNTAIETGDLVVTSGLGGRFPAGLPVGRIVTLERNPGRAFARADVVPLAAMDRNRIVLILEPLPEHAPEPGPEARSEAESGAEAGPEDQPRPDPSTQPQDQGDRE